MEPGIERCFSTPVRKEKIAQKEAAKEEAEMLERRSFSLKVYTLGDLTRVPLGSLDFGFDSKDVVHVAFAHGRHPPQDHHMVMVPYSSLPVIIDSSSYGNLAMSDRVSSVPNEDNKIVRMAKVTLYRRKGHPTDTGAPVA